MRGVERQRRVVGPTSGGAVSTGTQPAGGTGGPEGNRTLAAAAGGDESGEMLVGGETVRGRGGGLGWLEASGPGSDGG